MSDEQRKQFEAVFAEHFDAVLRFALARAEPEAAKDATAETFLAAWQSLSKLPAQPRGWLLVVARRKIVDHYRATGRRDALEASLAWQFDSTPDLADRLAEHDRVRMALAQLPQGDQELLRLIAWDGLTRTEAAQVLDCSPALLRVRLHRARRRLRQALDDQEPAPELFTDIARSESNLVTPEQP
jgi:RNA polymerase sigma-70 factor (ECF subfamily)